MSKYDFTKASDLVKFAKAVLKTKTRYELGGIGRTDADGTRVLDCIGLVKCFMWHDYNQNNSSYYGKTCPDYNCEQFFALAKKKGRIEMIPEVPGLIVYQFGHVGVYIGGGEVIEATASFGGKVVKSYFKGNHKGNRRTTWTHYFYMPGLTYDTPKKESSDASNKKDLKDVVLKVVNGAYGNGTRRKELLEKDGYNYAEVQKAVNEYITSNQKNTGKKFTLEQMVQKTINGDFGNGSNRKKAIESTGWDFETVQKAVNEKLS